MASGEISLEGALAYPLGQLDAGLKQMAEMINWSRLSNGIKSAALMRRAVHDAWQVYRHRRVFGSRLLDLPLAQRQLLKLQLPSEQALSMGFFTAEALDASEVGGANDARAVLRLATPVLKMRATRDARRVTGDAMEIRGGCGYVEDFVNRGCCAMLTSFDLGRHVEHRWHRRGTARNRPQWLPECISGGVARPARSVCRVAAALRRRIARRVARFHRIRGSGRRTGRGECAAGRHRAVSREFRDTARVRRLRDGTAARRCAARAVGASSYSTIAFIRAVR
jgi:alkylation response protein AidB-like acyl-CoA dehydrogenase